MNWPKSLATGPRRVKSWPFQELMNDWRIGVVVGEGAYLVLLSSFRRQRRCTYQSWRLRACAKAVERKTTGLKSPGGKAGLSRTAGRAEPGRCSATWSARCVSNVSGWNPRPATAPLAEPGSGTKARLARVRPPYRDRPKVQPFPSQSGHPSSLPPSPWQD